MYAKLFTSIYQGTLRGNSHGLLVFTNLLAHADANGEVDIHPRAIAEEIGLTQDDVRAALLVLEAPDEESRSPEEEGRRIIRLDEHRSWGWRIVNYVKYRSIRSEDDRREQNRLAQQRYRDKQKSAASNQGKPRKPESAQEEAEAEEEAKAYKKEAPRKRAAPSPAQTKPHDVAEQTWQDWLALRKAKRAPVTATVVDGARREAEKAAMGLEAFLQVWCRRGSQGLEAAWLRPEERGGYAPVNKQQALEQRNREVAAAWLPPELRAQQSGGV